MKQIEPMSVNYLIVLAISLGFLGFLAGTWSIFMIKSLNKLRTTFFSGTNGRNLEAVINELASGLQALSENQIILESHLKNLRQDFTLSVQKVGMVKFNPFEGGSGNLSFSLALLDGHNTGLIITSMHGREQNRIYTKQITQGKCDIQLTDEELKAIEQAQTYYKNLISH